MFHQQPPCNAFLLFNPDNCAVSFVRAHPVARLGQGIPYCANRKDSPSTTVQIVNARAF
jgi:hypothetical protein